MDSQISLGRFRVRKVNGEIIEATKLKTRGDDDNWPTFLLDGGGLLGVSASAVLGPAGDDECPVDGIERPADIDFTYGLNEGEEREHHDNNFWG